jgi:hypothetical protein
MSKDKSGPAFPLPLGNEDISPDVAGMTLRDYFAAKAMQAIITGSMADGTKFDKNDPEGVSIVAFFVADAMLKARSE